MPLVDMMREDEPVPALHDLRENIARAIHEHRNYEGFPGRSWDHAKHHDQWSALGSWKAAGAVMKVLPLDLKITASSKRE